MAKNRSRGTHWPNRSKKCLYVENRCMSLSDKELVAYDVAARALGGKAQWHFF